MARVKSSGSFKLRIYLIGLFFFVLGGLLVARLFFIQVKEHDFYEAKADRQYNSYKSKETISIRGDVYFKEANGTLISAATIKEGFLAALNPKLISDGEFACNKASEIIELDKDFCLERADKKDDPFEIIAHRLGLDEAQKINNLGIDGLNAFPEQWRFYPGDSLASQVLGFVGYKGDELVGRYGVEQYYEDILCGKKEDIKEGTSFAMLFVDLGKDFLSSNTYEGHDVVLTIEPRVQSFLENILETLIEEWDAENAGGIIVDPQTGAVIAMAGKPDFDPNNYGGTEDISYFKNPVVSSIFEMGSVFKPLTMAAAIDSGVITSKTTYVDNGYVILSGRRIENYDGKGRGLVDMQEVLNQSLNTGAVFLMQELGKNNFYEYLKNYGLDKATGIDLPDEVEGHLSNLVSGRDIEYATASFGQGVAVSPIEFTMAISSLANKGEIMRPYVVDKIVIDGGVDRVTLPKTERKVLETETAKEVTRMLVNVVDEALLGGTVKSTHYSIAAKTGTAQLIKEGGGYYEDQYLHSFFGYAPAFDAKFLIFLYLKKPQGVRYASHTLTEPFMKLMNFLLNYYEVPPDR